MSPSGKDNDHRDDSRRETLNKAVDKVERNGQEDDSPGGQIRRGWKENA